MVAEACRPGEALRVRPARHTYNGRVFHQVLGPEAAAAVRAACQRNDVTPFMLLQTAFALLVARCSHERDVVMGVPVGGRNHPDLESSIGLFVNNLVVLKHDGGLETQYMHMSKFAAGQQVGQRVAAKTVIGYVGTTGLSTGPHLHFGVKQNGAYIDPSKLTPIRAKGVTGSDLAAFKAEVARLDALLGGITIASIADGT